MTVEWINYPMYHNVVVIAFIPLSVDFSLCLFVGNLYGVSVLVTVNWANSSTVTALKFGHLRN